MKSRKSARFLMAAVASGVMLLLLSACGMGVKVPDPSAGDPPPGDDTTYVFQEDFTGFELGPFAVPEDWSIANGNGAWGSVEVVADAGVDTGRALRIASLAVPGPSGRNYHNFTVTTPYLPDIDDATTIGMEYKIRVVNSSGINVYLTQPGSNHIVVNGVGGGKLTYSDGSWQDLAALPDEWHTIRVIVDGAADTADYYLNGELIEAGTDLRNALADGSWTNTRVQLLVTTSETVTKEVRLADLKVWVID